MHQLVLVQLNYTELIDNKYLLKVLAQVKPAAPGKRKTHTTQTQIHFILPDKMQVQNTWKILAKK